MSADITHHAREACPRMLYRENNPHEIIGLLGYQFSSSGVKHPFMTI
jgi:hypothetical protein